jgi:carboxypeptidase family protein
MVGGNILLMFTRWSLALVVCGMAVHGFPQTQAPQATPVPGPEHEVTISVGEQPPDPRAPASISGTVVDPSGAVVAGAQVRLSRADPPRGGDQSPRQEVSGGDGEFAFANIAPGAFQLTVTASGFATRTFSGTLNPGEIETLPPMALEVAAAITEVRVGLSRAEVAEVAEEQLKIEEKQRVLGMIPNFYVSYVPHAAPLTAKQKFKLAARTVVDPVTFLVVGGTAGVEQAQNHFFEYGQGAEGYAKRFGANYADTVTGTFIGGAILPALLKQDPRYFYKGTGSVQSRSLYAIAMSVICKGDNGHWQPNYSGILGSLASGGISNLYYPAIDRDSAALTFDNTAIGIASTAISNLLQEFVIRKLTPKLKRDASQP